MHKNHPVHIATDLQAQLLEEAALAAPQECCGLLLGMHGRISAIAPARNVAGDPMCQFEIDPRALIDAHRVARSGGPQLLGHYHSHPTGNAMPSATDRAMAAGDGLVWAIVAAGDITFWRDDEAGFTPLAAESQPG